MTTIDALIDRAERAGEDAQREVLEAAFTAIYNLQLTPKDWGTLGWSKADRFLVLLDAQAYLDAAMMLVPEGEYCCVKLYRSGLAWAELGGRDGHKASTPALALVAASLRAHKESGR